VTCNVLDVKPVHLLGKGGRMDSSELTRAEIYERGLAIRREVLGANHVDRSLNQVSEFSRPMQELVTEYCWGNVWARDGLPRKTRILLNLAML
jgi:4-carboxymuconolactone decarboxylase